MYFLIYASTELPTSGWDIAEFTRTEVPVMSAHTSLKDARKALRKLDQTGNATGVRILKLI
jgi:hypothetical protein